MTTTADAAATGRARGRGLPKDLGQRYALVGAWIAVVILFSVLEPDTFATTGNLQNILGSQAVLLVLALGLMLPLTTGDFDLSVASVLTLSSMTVALLNAQEGWALLPAILAGVAVGVIVGAINGALVVGMGLDSFIVTLGIGTFVQGIVLWISDGQTISGMGQALSEWTILNRIFGVSLVFFYALALCVALWWLLSRTALGRRMLIVGRGPSVARLSGLRVTRIRWGSLVASGTIAGVAGVLYAGTTGGADPSSGSSFLLPAFAAAFLGATAVVPGRFNAWGTFIAVYFLVTGITGLQMVGLDSWVQQLFYGGALVLAVALSHLVRRRREGARA